MHEDSRRCIEVVFVGEGKALDSLKDQAKEAPNISFLPHMSFSAVQLIISGADYGLVSLEPGIYQYAFPSKTLTYLGLSVPLAVVVEPDSELATSIKENGIGYCSGGMRVEDIASMFEAMVKNHHASASNKINAQEYYSEYCDRKRVMNRWSSLISGLGADHATGV